MRSASIVLAVLVLAPALADAGAPDAGIALPEEAHPSAGVDVVLAGARFDPDARSPRTAFSQPQGLGPRPPLTAPAQADPAAPCEPTGDAGDTRASAGDLAVPQRCEGSLLAGDKADRFRVTVATGSVVDVTMRPVAGADFDLCAFTPSDQRATCSVLEGDAEESVRLSGEAGVWVVQVYVYAGDGPYELASSAPLTERDCGTGADASNSYASPTPIPFPVSCFGRVSDDDWRDWYAITLPLSGHVEVALTPAAGLDADLCVFGPEDTYRCSSIDSAGAPERVLFAVPDTDGNHSIWVAQWRGDGDYLLDVRSVPPPPPQDDCGSGDDAGASTSSALAVAYPVSCAAEFDAFDHADVFAFDVTDADFFEVAIAPPAAAAVDMCLYDPEGYAWGCIYGAGREPLRAGGIAGTWSIAFEIDTGTGPYSFTVDAIPAPPVEDACAGGVDAGDSKARASAAPLPGACTGAGAELDPYDWYVVDLPASTWFVVTVQPDAVSDVDLCWMRADTHGRCSYAAGRGIADRVAIPTGNESGPWFLLVYTWTTDGAIANYTLTMEESAPVPQDDCGSGGDASGDSATATVIEGPVTCGGRVDGLYGDMADRYVVDLPKGGLVSIRAGEGLVTYACVLTPNPYIGSCRSLRAGQTYTVSAQQGYADGTWRIVVYPYASTDSGPYEIHVAKRTTQTATGHVLVGHPMDTVAVNALLGPSEHDGIDGVWVPLAQTATGGETVQLGATRGTLADFDAIFYDAGGARLEGQDCVTAGDDSCNPPSGAAWAFVMLFDGADADFSLTYTYLDTP